MAEANAEPSGVTYLKDGETFRDVGDAAQVKDSIRDAKRVADRRKETLIRFMSDSDGRAWLCDLLQKCRVGRNPFASDALLMAHSCGEMNIGLQVMAELQAADIGLYMKMMEEDTNG